MPRRDGSPLSRILVFGESIESVLPGTSVGSVHRWVSASKCITPEQSVLGQRNLIRHSGNADEGQDEPRIGLRKSVFCAPAE